MPITVAYVEGRLLGSAGPYLERTGLDHMTADGTNDDLAGPIADAVLSTGGTLADPMMVTDADLIGIEGYGVKRFLDVCRLYTFEMCRGNWAKVDFSAGGNSQSLDQLFKQLMDLIAAAEERIANATGPVDAAGAGASASAQLTAGVCPPAARATYPDCGTPWTGRGAY